MCMCFFCNDTATIEIYPLSLHDALPICRPNVCSSLTVLGVHRDGGFSQYAVVPSKNAYVIPNEINDEFAVMIEPFTIAANATAQLKPTQNDVALMYGAGPMGLTSVQALKGVYNVKEVIVVDRIDEIGRASSREGV